METEKFISPGIFKHQPDSLLYIDVNGVAELKSHSVGTDGVTIGGNVTLSKAIQILKDASKMEGYEYCADLSKHWSRIANTPVRNVSCLILNICSGDSGQYSKTLVKIALTFRLEQLLET
jgi:xanthine dehydrogenase iron-sulfur cluster and FAD-binding subunit A